jgi:hypothetical protein
MREEGEKGKRRKGAEEKRGRGEKGRDSRIDIPLSPLLLFFCVVGESIHGFRRSDC